MSRSRLPGTPRQQRAFVRLLDWLLWLGPVFFIAALALGNVRDAVQTVFSVLLVFVTRRFWKRRMDEEARSA